MQNLIGLKWRLPSLKKSVRLNDLIELRSEMRRTRAQNYEEDSEYQDYCITDSLARFPEPVKTSRSRSKSFFLFSYLFDLLTKKYLKIKKVAALIQTD